MDELMSIPLLLDVEFELITEAAAPPRPRKEESPYAYLSDPFFESLLQVNQVRLQFLMQSLCSYLSHLLFSRLSPHRSLVFK